MPVSSPLIITVALDLLSHQYFTELRDVHFPRHCNFLQAHLTLFHHLPSDIVDISEVMQRVTQRPLLHLEITGVKNIGNGVVFTIISEELLLLHKTMQQSFNKYLISQDRQKIWPHITVQNKVSVFKAQQTTKNLLQDFKPFSIKGIGLSAWIYLNGPWQHQQDYLFKMKDREVANCKLIRVPVTE